MDTTTHHVPAATFADWIGQIRAAAPGAIALSLIVTSIVTWAAILDRVLSARP
ncbi:MAG TPA: hypothetical protein VHS27_09330 [Gaiellales bacterium]|jgi:hypothetical protein|nr:hypothetical protein [Gaiellales bacterium]